MRSNGSVQVFGYISGSTHDWVIYAKRTLRRRFFFFFIVHRRICKMQRDFLRHLLLVWLSCQAVVHIASKNRTMDSNTVNCVWILKLVCVCNLHNYFRWAMQLQRADQVGWRLDAIRGQSRDLYVHTMGDGVWQHVGRHWCDCCMQKSRLCNHR